MRKDKGNSCLKVICCAYNLWQIYYSQTLDIFLIHSYNRDLPIVLWFLKVSIYTHIEMAWYIINISVKPIYWHFSPHIYCIGIIWRWKQAKVLYLYRIVRFLWGFLVWALRGLKTNWTILNQMIFHK